MGGTQLCKSWKSMENTLNDAVSKSFVGRYFKLEARKTCFTKELRAATATFLTMVYILTVNAAIIGDSGGTCSAADDAGYQLCLARLKSDLILSTALASMIGSLAMGLLANLPLGLAPGMGPNAYFTYNLVGFHGTGPISYKTALAVVLVEGCAFFLIAALGLRAKLARAIPRSVRLACAAGIGLFIAFTGLQGNLGLGLVGPDPSTLLTLTGCRVTDPQTGACLSAKMQSPTLWLGLVGLVIICYGMMKNVKGSMILGILFVTFVSWFRNTNVTIFPHTPLGNESYNYFKKVVDFNFNKSTWGAISFKGFNKSEVWVALITLLYVDVLATTGTLYTLAEIGGFTDENGSFEGEYVAYMVDAGTTVVASLLGVTPVATYVESSAGLREGGRTGLTAVFIGLYFGLALMFGPIMVSVPSWAIGPPLVMVGVLMMKVVKDIDFVNMKEAMPAFVTILLMPLTYSISNGIIAGIGFYVVLNAYDYGVKMIKRVIKMRRRVVREENQVSVVAEMDSLAEIT
ncbi:hypothetical protein V2J09_015042 [Rumex salicifolius]